MNSPARQPVKHTAKIINLHAVAPTKARCKARSTKRQIQTVYYSDKRATTINKTNLSLYPRSAVVRCVDHMQENHYGAWVAEVYDLRTGTLYAVIKRNIDGFAVLYENREALEQFEKSIGA